MKRRIALITALFMLVFSLPVFAAEFTDMPAQDSKYYDAFTYAINKKLISGDGVSLNPDGHITKAEALTIISRIKPFDCEESDVTVFGVSKDKWYYSTIAKAYTAGYITADAQTGKINAEEILSQEQASVMVTRCYGKSPTYTNATELCTRAVFIHEIYMQAPDGKAAAGQIVPTENVSEAPSEMVTEYTDLKAKAAQEAMQLALGILPDGTVYAKTSSYKDSSQSDWSSGPVSGSSRPSGGSSDKDDSPKPTEPPTEDPVEEPTEPTVTPTEPGTEPTEAPTEEPTEPQYGDYDGPVDNDKDNIIDDPFDDGWRPPGWVDPDTGEEDNGNGGYDEEDDFIIEDDDPDWSPTEPSEPETEPSEPETEPSEPETEPSEPETEPSEPETEPSEPETEPSEPETEPSEPETEPSEPETEPSEPEEDNSEAVLPEDEDDDEDSTEENEPSDEDTELLSKEWWFD